MYLSKYYSRKLQPQQQYQVNWYIQFWQLKSDVKQQIAHDEDHKASTAALTITINSDNQD